MKNRFFAAIFILFSITQSAAFGDGAPESDTISQWRIAPYSLVKRTEPPTRRAAIFFNARSAYPDATLTVRRDGEVWSQTPLKIVEGDNAFPIFIPYAAEKAETVWTIRDGETTLAERTLTLEPPRNWTLYIVSASHTDIGLHNSQYIQRKTSVEYLDAAKQLAAETADRPDASRYRYVIEGTWIWGNYTADRGEKAAREYIDALIRPGIVGLGATCAGNHTQVYGFEELCRSIYTRRDLIERWGIAPETMVMSDNNGITWPLVGPYADAGIKNILFSPNQWNPIPSKLVPMDKSKPGAIWNPDAGGGGSRVDVRWDSPLPMVFYWLGADEKSRILVWCSAHYDLGGAAFGVHTKKIDFEKVPPTLSRQLEKMEKRYPYDVWVFCSYYDDEAPNLHNADFVQKWNAEWLTPTFRTVGNLSEPFDRLREKFDAQIPTLRGDITAGWAQHPVATAELLGQKRLVDAALPTAEKLASLAAALDTNYVYPAERFRRAWRALIYNDEHSYGTSGYQGRRVYETWLQHRDWIDKAQTVASEETERGLAALAENVAAEEPSGLFFNPTLIRRSETVTLPLENGETVVVKTPEIPPFGYASVPLSRLTRFDAPVEETSDAPPTVENRFYRLTFAPDGSISSAFDKELRYELVDSKAEYRLNQFVYTRDNHRTFITPPTARFRILRGANAVTVVAETSDEQTGAACEYRVTLPEDEKRIDIDNRFRHFRDLFNQDRYKRYGYFAFPFDVPDGEFIAQLNGCTARPKRDVTGHGTDAYLAARDFAAIENGSFGAAVVQVESSLIEFGHIHPDKTDYGRPYASPSHFYSYVLNDWLQMHVPSGEALDYRFRYVVTSYGGNWQKAKIAQLAERVHTPPLVASIPAQSGRLPASLSFLSSDRPNLSLLTVKASETAGEGLIVRLHETDGETVDAALEQRIVPNARLERRSVLEYPEGPLEKFALSFAPFDFLTVSIARADGALPALTDEAAVLKRERDAAKIEKNGPGKIGAVDTGLVTTPRAVHGEKCGQLYLEWSQNAEPNLACYKLYRSANAGFEPNESNFLADVPPGDYVVARYEDLGLDDDTRYYYRVRAVDSDGRLGPFSDEFSAATRKPFE